MTLGALNLPALDASVGIGQRGCDSMNLYITLHAGPACPTWCPTVETPKLQTFQVTAGKLVGPESHSSYNKHVRTSQRGWKTIAAPGQESDKQQGT